PALCGSRRLWENAADGEVSDRCRTTSCNGAMTRADPSGEPAREPAYRAAHRQLYDRIGTQDGCITFLLVELRALQKRVTKLEQRNDDLAAAAAAPPWSQSNER